MQRHRRGAAATDPPVADGRAAARWSAVVRGGAWLLPPGVALALHGLLLAGRVPATIFRAWLAVMLGLLAARALLFGLRRRARTPEARRWALFDLSTLLALGAGLGFAATWAVLPGEVWLLLAQTLWLAALAATAMPGCPGAPRHGLAFALPALLPAQLRLLASGDLLFAGLGLANLLVLASSMLFFARAARSTVDRLAEIQGERLARQTARRRRTVLALRAAQRRVRALSNIDALTGLANRSVFERVLEREWARARREQRPVSLLVCDVDCFRQYDAHYGALAADRCLERVASIVAARSRRAGDLVARHGRDRFALLLPGASEFAALDIADSIRSDVFGLTLLHGASDAERVVTVSCGVATLIPGSTDAAGTLTEAAMHALRCAKRAGRNRVRMAGAAPAMDGR